MIIIKLRTDSMMNGLLWAKAKYSIIPRQSAGSQYENHYS